MKPVGPHVGGWWHRCGDTEWAQLDGVDDAMQRLKALRIGQLLVMAVHPRFGERRFQATPIGGGLAVEVGELTSPEVVQVVPWDAQSATPAVIPGLVRPGGSAIWVWAGPQVAVPPSHALRIAGAWLGAGRLLPGWIEQCPPPPGFRNEVTLTERTVDGEDDVEDFEWYAWRWAWTTEDPWQRLQSRDHALDQLQAADKSLLICAHALPSARFVQADRIGAGSFAASVGWLGEQPAAQVVRVGEALSGPSRVTGTEFLAIAGAWLTTGQPPVELDLVTLPNEH